LSILALRPEGSRFYRLAKRLAADQVNRYGEESAS
jgi:hypothetical protein